VPELGEIDSAQNVASMNKPSGGPLPEHNIYLKGSNSINQAGRIRVEGHQSSPVGRVQLEASRQQKKKSVVLDKETTWFEKGRRNQLNPNREYTLGRCQGGRRLVELLGRGG